MDGLRVALMPPTKLSPSQSMNRNQASARKVRRRRKHQATINFHPNKKLTYCPRRPFTQPQTGTNPLRLIVLNKAEPNKFLTLEQRGLKTDEADVHRIQIRSAETTRLRTAKCAR